MRTTKLADLNPRWGSAGEHASDHWITFDCPEGHDQCQHTIPFTPGLDNKPVLAHGHAIWQRVSGTSFADLSLQPSIRRVPKHASREAAIAAGCIPEYITASLLCAFHGYITNGEITFCSDSR